MPAHIVDSSKYNKSQLPKRNTAVKNITDLIKNSVLIDISPNNKKQIKPNVDNYLRFYVPVRINDDIYTIRISAENSVSKNLFNILSADVYNLIIDKKMTPSSPSAMGNLLKTSSDNSINHNGEKSNPEQIILPV